MLVYTQDIPNFSIMGRWTIDPKRWTLKKASERWELEVDVPFGLVGIHLLGQDILFMSMNAPNGGVVINREFSAIRRMNDGSTRDISYNAVIEYRPTRALTCGRASFQTGAARSVTFEDGGGSLDFNMIKGPLSIDLRSGILSNDMAQPIKAPAGVGVPHMGILATMSDVVDERPTLLPLSGINEACYLGLIDCDDSLTDEEALIKAYNANAGMTARSGPTPVLFNNGEPSYIQGRFDRFTCLGTPITTELSPVQRSYMDLVPWYNSRCWVECGERVLMRVSAAQTSEAYYTNELSYQFFALQNGTWVTMEPAQGIY